MIDTALTEPAWWCRNMMEKQMAKAYTRNIFNRFQKEMPKSFMYQCDYLNGYRLKLSIIGPPIALWIQRVQGVRKLGRQYLLMQLLQIRA
jgi:hypothetical protein